MMNLLEVGPKLFGHVLIRDVDTDEVLTDTWNALHLENMSLAMASSLANRPTGHVHQMVFGNGASSVSSIGTVTYFSPNVTGSTSQLYNQTYQKVVDDLSPLNTDPTNNYMRVNHQLGNTFSDLVVTCNLSYSEPSDQSTFDTAPSVTGTYVFDEIGLKTFDASGSGSLLCHVIFHPVQKSLNRSIEVIYTIRIVMA